MNAGQTCVRIGRARDFGDCERIDKSAANVRLRTRVEWWRKDEKDDGSSEPCLISRWATIHSIAFW